MAGLPRAERFVALFADPVFRRLARSSQVIAEYGACDRVDERLPMAQVILNERKGVTRAIVSSVTTLVGPRGSAAALGVALGLWSPWAKMADVAIECSCRSQDLRDAVEVYRRPEALVLLADRLGLDAMRGYLAGYLAMERRGPWELEQASLADLLATVTLLGITLKPGSFVDYAIGQRLSQHARDAEAARWLDLWADTLAMQDLVYGRVSVKYPSTLAATHDTLIREGTRIRHALSPTDADGRADPFETHRARLEGHSHADDSFLIRPPRDVDEMLAEARAQRNCLASYVKAFEHGDTDIYLMREAGDPDTPCVTVEVRGGRVRQAFQAGNAELSPPQRAWLDSWCDAQGIRRLGRSRALCVDLHYDDERGARTDPMAAAERRDLMRNRPSARTR